MRLAAPEEADVSGTDSKLSSISAFFPCYNDSNTIPGLVRAVAGSLRRISDDYEIIVVDDGSSDNSRDVVRGLMAEVPNLRLVEHERNKGYGGALRTGFASATKDYVFYTDGDGQYDPAEVEILTHLMVPGVDVVNGYKISRQDPWYRHIVGGAYQSVTRIMFSFPIRDVDCDFRLLRRSVFDRLTLESNDGAICIEMVRKLKDSGCRMVEVPVHHYPRAYGSSQFFKPQRIARALIGVARWYVRLVLLRNQKRHAQAFARSAALSESEAEAVISG
jgi:glycosyltransferase involved in cell wall biosynthesis